jgi:hypothetical protein
MNISKVKNTCRAALGAAAVACALVLLRLQLVSFPLAASLVAFGALLLLAANPNSVYAINAKVALRRKPAPLVASSAPPAVAYLPVARGGHSRHRP